MYLLWLVGGVVALCLTQWLLAASEARAERPVLAWAFVSTGVGWTAVWLIPSGAPFQLSLVALSMATSAVAFASAWSCKGNRRGANVRSIFGILMLAAALSLTFDYLNVRWSSTDEATGALVGALLGLLMSAVILIRQRARKGDRRVE